MPSFPPLTKRERQLVKLAVQEARAQRCADRVVKLAEDYWLDKHGRKVVHSTMELR